MSESQNGAVVVAKHITRRYGEGDTAVDALRGITVDMPTRPVARLSRTASSSSPTTRSCATSASAIQTLMEELAAA